MNGSSSCYQWTIWKIWNRILVPILMSGRKIFFCIHAHKRFVDWNKMRMKKKPGQPIILAFKVTNRDFFRPNDDDFFSVSNNNKGDVKENHKDSFIQKCYYLILDAFLVFSYLGLSWKNNKNQLNTECMCVCDNTTDQTIRQWNHCQNLTEWMK